MTIHRLQVAFITGRSNRYSWHLSEVQKKFLQRLATPGRHLVPVNFPYSDCPSFYKPTPLWLASINNAIEYFSSRRSTYRNRYRPQMSRMLEIAQHTVLLSGSCGLELLNNLELSPTWNDRISVFAYGPVSRSRPVFRSFSVQGRYDFISRYWVKAADYRVRAGHLEYLTNERVMSECLKFIASVEDSLVPVS